MKKLSHLRFLLAITAVIISAAPARAQSLTANLPESDGVVTVDVRRIVNEALPRLLTAEQMTRVQSALSKAKQIAGFDVSNIEPAVIGLRLNRGAPLSVPGMLLVMRGSFNADALISLLKIGFAGKYQDEKYGMKSLTLMRLSDFMQTAKATQIAFAALDGHTLAVGIPDYLKAALDAESGKNRIKPELVQLAGREPNALIAIAGLLPQGLLGKALPQDAQGNEEITRLASSIEQLHFSLNMDAQSFPLALMLKTNTVENANAITGLLQMIAQFGTGVSDKNLKAVVEALKITSQNTEVQVRTVLPQDLVAPFVRDLLAPAAKPAEPKSEPKPEPKKP